jgi:hypothetical protein
VHLRTAWRREVDAALRRVDALVTPTVPFPAFTVEAQLAAAGPPDTGWLTRHFNFSGHPAVTLPCGRTGAGLPVGLQLAGRPFGEATLLRIAHAYEQATTWHTWRPEIQEVPSTRGPRVAPCRSGQARSRAYRGGSWRHRGGDPEDKDRPGSGKARASRMERSGNRILATL